MKVEHTTPPNYDEICLHFNVRHKKNVVFTYGDTLYMPNCKQPSDDLLVHEETHQKQQGDNPEVWWKDYFASTGFRLFNELEAYRNQYQYFKQHHDREDTRRFVRRIAKDLSGEMYGNVISKSQAVELIKGEQDE